MYKQNKNAMNKNNNTKMELQLIFLESQDANYAQVHINNRPVMTQIVDRFDQFGCYHQDLPTNKYHPFTIMNNVNKIELIQYDEKTKGIKISHITNSSLVMELALFELDEGEYAVSLRLDNPEYTRMSEAYRLVFNHLIKTEIDKKFSN